MVQAKQIVTPDVLSGLKDDPNARGLGEQFGKATAAIQSMTGAISAIVNVSAKFAEAAAPSAVLVLNQAMYDFSAVIGQALTPIVRGAAEGIKMLGGVLLPVMRALTPVIAKLTGAFLSLLEQALPALETMGEIFVSVATVVGDLFDAISPLITVSIAFTTAFWEVVKTLLESLGSLFGEGTMGTFKSAIQTFSKFLLLGAAHLAVFIGKLFGVAGGGSFVEGLLKATDPNKPKPADITGMGVAKDAQFLGFQEYSKKVSQAALIAGTGAAPEKPANEWLKDVHAQLLKARAEEATALTEAMTKLEKWITETLPKRIAAAVKGEAWDISTDTMNKLDEVNPIPGFSALRRWALGDR